jgi:YidC/Oxa1 family membrane protein insertase
MKKVQEERRLKMQQEQLAEQERLAQEALADSLYPASRAERGLEEDDFETAAEPDAGERTVSDGSGLPAATASDIKLITVRTPLYELVITTAGAEIVSAKLTNFETDGRPIDLVAQDDTPRRGGMVAVTLVGETRSQPLGDVLFDAYSSGSPTALSDGSVFQLDANTPEKELVFTATSADGGVIERYYRFNHDSYLIQAGVRFATAHVPYVRDVSWSLGPGMGSTEVNVEEDHAAMRATLRLGDEYHRKKPGDFDENFTGTVHWAALQNKYFTTILMAQAPAGGQAHSEGVKAESFMTASIELPLSERLGRADQMIDVYLGPIDYEALKAFDRGLEKNVEMGFWLFRPVSGVILWCLLWLYKFIPNYGVVIIILSVVTKVLFYRLTHKSFKSMRDLQSLQPRIQALKDKYGDDKQRLSQETMKLYKEAGVNPLGGCLPMLLQMPVFIALFNVLRSTIELRGAPFVGWMNDLSQQDVLATMPFSLPFMGDAVSVLPILMGVGMLVQSKIGGSIAGPTSSAAQPKAFQYMLPIVFTVLFYRMPSGLVLYWLVNTVLSVAQQYYINKGADEEERANKAKAAENETADEKPEKKKPSRSKTKPKK